MLWESIHKKEFCIISIYHHNIIIIYNLRVISILVRVIKSLRCSIHIIIFNHCTVALHFSYFLHCEQFPFTQHQIVTAPPHRGLQIPRLPWRRQLMLKSEAKVEAEVVVSDIPHRTIFPTSKNADFLVETVRNRETKYYKLALLEKWLLWKKIYLFISKRGPLG